jgi:hypothetical protein
LYYVQKINFWGKGDRFWTPLDERYPAVSFSSLQTQECMLDTSVNNPIFVSGRWFHPPPFLSHFEGGVGGAVSTNTNPIFIHARQGRLAHATDLAIL